ncbi:MAG TPA: ABC transporter ATP-binding protein [Polyangiaceae bacterium]|nr:ABC transporter ATP-binding protein [Polyangiaceae bacterium]
MRWQVRVQAKIGTLELDVELDGGREPLLLVGPNGAGKTTLLRIVAGAYPPLAGRIQLGERVLFDARERVDLPPEERRVGYVPQGYGLFPHLSVLDNVSFGLASRAHFEPPRVRRDKALRLLGELGSAGLAERFPRELSGGEKQRVALARALILEPDVLLLDEPLSALDSASRRTMRSFLAAHLAERERPALVVSHDLKDVIALGGQVAVLENGRIVQRGTARELARAPQTAFIAELFQRPDELTAPGEHDKA